MNTYFKCKDEKHPLDYMEKGIIPLSKGMTVAYHGIVYVVNDVNYHLSTEILQINLFVRI